MPKMKQISFLSGTRADYGKIKPYIAYLCRQQEMRVHIFMTGMQTQKKYGNSYREIVQEFGKTCHLITDTVDDNQDTAKQNAHILSAYDEHLRADKIDFVFVHGDRPEMLSAAMAAVLNNIPVCHIEAGDFSGSIDESLRHAISKLSHRFFVADERAKLTLMQLGEHEQNIHVIGNSSLANEIKTSFEMPADLSFEKYGILIYHPTTTMPAEDIRTEITAIMEALNKTGRSFVVVMPNNDLNHTVIEQVYANYQNNLKFAFLKSLPYDDFRHLLEKADILVGNSSCGIKEAPFLGVPVIDIGRRQNNRYNHLKLPAFIHLDSPAELEKILCNPPKGKKVSLTRYRQNFLNRLTSVFSDDFWCPPLQKTFQNRQIFCEKEKLNTLKINKKMPKK